jgi:hypothetical protein
MQATTPSVSSERKGKTFFLTSPLIGRFEVNCGPLLVEENGIEAANCLAAMWTEETPATRDLQNR